MRATKDVDFFHAVYGEPFEDVIEHGDVDERKKEFGVLSRGWTETLQNKGMRSFNSRRKKKRHRKRLQGACRGIEA